MFDRPLVDDKTASASFAVLGILILLLAIMAAAHMGRIERERHAERLRKDIINSLDVELENAFDSLEEKLRLIAVRSAFDGNGRSSDTPHQLFSIRSADHLEDHEGWDQGSIEVRLLEHNITLDYRTVSIEDNVQTPGDPDPEMSSVNRTFSYKVTGWVSAESIDEASGHTMQKEREIEIPVDIPYPFMKDRIDSFGNSLSREKGNVGRITEYILTTLAQYRTMIKRDGEGNMDPGSLLDPDDVEMAVNLALILEMASQFRGYDNRTVESLCSNHTGGSVDMSELLGNYLDSGRIDPGDIVVLFHVYAYDGILVDKNDTRSLDFEVILAQTLNTLVDQFILRYFDYMGITNVVDTLYQGYRSLRDGVAALIEPGLSYLDSILGDDEEEVSEEQLEQVKNWVEETFRGAGLMSTTVLRAVYHPFDTINGERMMGYPWLPDDFEYSEDMSMKVRLTGDEHRWYQYSCEHGEPHRGERGDTCNETIEVEDSSGEIVEVRCGAEEKVIGFDVMEIDMEVLVDGGPMYFRERDILQGNDEVWEDFFLDHYDEETEDDIDSISDAVRAVVEKIADDLINNPELQEALEEFEKVKVDVHDRRSLFDDISDAVDGALEETIEHYRNNPADILNIIMEFLHEEDKPEPRVDALKDVLKEEYDTFTENSVESALERTADRITSENSPWLKFSVDGTETSKGGLNDSVDFSWSQEGYPSREEISQLVRKRPFYSGVKEELEDPLDDAFQEIKEREIDEVNFEKEHSPEDGLIIQALDSYQFNTSYTTQGVRSGHHLRDHADMIVDVSPNPATVGEDIIHFEAEVEEDWRPLHWISDIDGGLAKEKEFEMDAELLTPGKHTISFHAYDDERERRIDNTTLIVNLIPVAQISTIEPSPSWEGKEVEMRHESYDKVGDIVNVTWDLGDGNTHYGDEPNHTYEEPGNYTITLEIEDEHGSKNSTTEQILVDDRPRVIDVIPDGEGPWPTDHDFSVVFSETVAPETLNHSVSPTVDFDVSWIEDNTTAVFTPIDFLDRNTDHELVIHDVRDVDNGTASPLYEEYEHFWKTEDFARLESYYPLEESEVGLQRDVILTFSEPIVLVDDVEDLVSGDHGWEAEREKEGKRLKLTHEPFPPGEYIELQIDLGALEAEADHSDVLTQQDQGSFTMTFKTEDVSLPMIVEKYPSHNSVGVDVDQDIIIRFDEPINRSSFEITVTPYVKDLAMDWNDDVNEVTISHSGFEANTWYAVELECVDEYGRTVIPKEGLEHPFTFQTRDHIAPFIVEVYPRDGAEQFLTQAPLTVIFSEPVDPSTLQVDLTEGPVLYDMVWNEEKTIVYIYYEGMEPGTVYEFCVENVKDEYGNGLLESVTISFATSYNGEHIEGNLFERKAWTFLGDRFERHSGSLFDLLEDMLGTTTRGMLSNIRTSGIEYRPVLDDRFNYEKGSTLNLDVHMDPFYLEIKDEINITVMGGTHYTDLTRISSRPFETHLNVTVPDYEIEVNVSKEDPDLLTNGSYMKAAVNESFALGFSLNITVATGWRLNDVEYELSSDLLSDIRAFMREAWNLVSGAVTQVIDGIHYLLQLADELIQRVKEYAEEILSTLGEYLYYLVGILADIAQDMVERLVGSGVLESLDRVLRLLNFDMLVEITPEGTVTDLPGLDQQSIRYMNVSFGGKIRGTGYTFNLNLLHTNVIAFGTINVRNFHAGWIIDPLAHEDEGKYSSNYHLSGKNEDGTEVEFEGPSEKGTKEKLEKSLGDYTPINQARIPIGPVVVSDIDLGFRMETMGKNETLKLVEGIFHTSFYNAVEAVKETAIGLTYLVDFVRTLVSMMLNEFINLAKELVTELSLFFKAAISGVEVEFAFGISGGQAISDFVLWIAESIMEFIENIVDMSPSLPSKGLPDTVISNTFISTEVGRGEIACKFTADVPALANIAGRDMGPWSMDFGVSIPEKHLIKGTISGV